MGLRSRMVLACCAVGLLAACSTAAADGGAEPVDRLPAGGAAEGEPVAAASPTSTARAVAPPALPDAARAQDHVGAAAFVRHWWQLFNHAYATGDAAALTAVSTSECVFCQSVIDDVEARAAAGERTEGGEVKVLDVAAPPGAGAAAYRVIAVVEQATGAVTDHHGVERGTISHTRSGNDFLVVWNDLHWVVAGVALTTAEDL